MTTEPSGHDVVIGESAAADIAAQGLRNNVSFALALAELLVNPTESNPYVRVARLVSGSGGDMFVLSIEGITIVYRFINTLVTEVLLVEVPPPRLEVTED